MGNRARCRRADCLYWGEVMEALSIISLGVVGGLVYWAGYGIGVFLAKRDKR